jgi:hypothetical protein
MKRKLEAMAYGMMIGGIFTACTATEPPTLNDEWTGVDARGNRMTFVFAESGDALWIVEPAGLGIDTVALSYRADLSLTPVHIDLDGFDHGPLEGFTMYGILEFDGPDSFRLDLEPGLPGGDPAEFRPSEFTYETVLFTRSTAARFDGDLP